MDILKLLSRSTKQKSKLSSGKSGVTDALPSAGTSNNPQLYHDVVESRGKKRKRSTEKVATQTEDQVQETGELNFFAPKITKADRTRAPVTNEVEHTVKQSPVELLDLEECRQILRSHRLKITRLAAQQTAEKKIKKSKKPKAAKKAEPAKNKELYPQPLQAFSHLQTTYNISPRLGENLEQQGYKIPTEVQMGSLPLLLDPTTALSASPDEDVGTKGSGFDLLAVAPTGSGKTLAFLIPVVDQIVQRRRKSNQRKDHILEAIVVAPTKELASQIVNEAKKLSIGTGVKILGMRKGTRIVAKESEENLDGSSEGEEDSGYDDDEKRTGQTQPLARADVLVTTPGLLLSALSLRSPNDYAPLPTVRTLVLDEADVLLDPLFRDQTLGIWNSCQNHELRVTLWSATMGSNIEALASSTMEERKKKLELERASPIIRLVVGLKDSAIPNITHRLTYAATEPGKLLALRQLLHPTAGSADGSKSLRPPFLVFTQTIPRAIALHSELLYDIPAEAGGSSRLAVLHSDLSDSARDHIMTRFRNGEIWVLITTDILSRGVDFRGINGVVNYDVPNSGASYIHRVGRTGRAGRNGGVAVTFYTQEDIPYVRNIATIIAASEKQAGKPASETSMQKWLLDALPKPSKEEKQKLKKYGVEARRGGLGAKDGKGRAKAQISTKSGYERRLEHNRKGAIQGSRRRIENEDSKVHGPEQGSDDDEWGGIDD